VIWDTRFTPKPTGSHINRFCVAVSVVESVVTIHHIIKYVVMCWRDCTLTCSGYEKECLSYQIPWQKKLFCIFRKFTFKLYVFLVVFCNVSMIPYHGRKHFCIFSVRKFTFKLNSWSYFAALVSLVAQFLIRSNM
jgi:hypothetical protein